MTASWFYSVAAQEDNLGDLVIRRKVLELIRRWHGDVELHLFIGDMTESYLAGLRLPEDVTLYRSSRRWMSAALVNKKAGYALSPGPVGRRVLTLPGNLPRVLLAAKARRGAGVLAIGQSYPHGLAVRSERFVRKNGSPNCVRDQPSSSVLGADLELDLALLNHESADSLSQARGGRRLAVSFRGDVAMSSGQLAALDRAKKLGMDVTLYAQVRRDRDAMAELADRAGLAFLDWPQGQTHDSQLAAVLSMLGSCSGVLSNRLHANLFGIVSGARAVVCEASGSKSRSAIAAYEDLLGVSLSVNLADLDGEGIPSLDLPRVRLLAGERLSSLDGMF